MVYNTQNYRVFGPCLSSGILETRKHNVSETGSVSVLRRRGGHMYSDRGCPVIEISSFYGTQQGRAIAPGVSRWLPQYCGPGSIPSLVMWDLLRTKWRWGSFSSSTLVSPANLHSSNCSTIPSCIIWDWYNRPVVAAVPSGISLAPLRIR
jgi:hypothetical protein